MQADPKCTRNADRLYSKVKVLESRLDQIICLLETVAKNTKKEIKNEV